MDGERRATLDDAARLEYKTDPRVYFVPGHPVLQTAMPELLRGLGLGRPGSIALQWQHFRRWGMHSLVYSSTHRKALTIAQPLGAGAGRYGSNDRSAAKALLGPRGTPADR